MFIRQCKLLHFLQVNEQQTIPRCMCGAPFVVFYVYTSSTLILLVLGGFSWDQREDTIGNDHG